MTLVALSHIGQEHENALRFFQRALQVIFLQQLCFSSELARSRKGLADSSLVANLQCWQAMHQPCHHQTLRTSALHVLLCRQVDLRDTSACTGEPQALGGRKQLVPTRFSFLSFGQPCGLLQVDPTFVYAYTLAGHEYFATEDFDKGLGCYRHALRLDARHYNAWWGLHEPPSCWFVRGGKCNEGGSMQWPNALLPLLLKLAPLPGLFSSARDPSASPACLAAVHRPRAWRRLLVTDINRFTYLPECQYQPGCHSLHLSQVRDRADLHAAGAVAGGGAPLPPRRRHQPPLLRAALLHRHGPLQAAPPRRGPPAPPGAPTACRPPLTFCFEFFTLPAPLLHSSTLNDSEGCSTSEKVCIYCIASCPAACCASMPASLQLCPKRRHPAALQADERWRMLPSSCAAANCNQRGHENSAVLRTPQIAINVDARNPLARFERAAVLEEQGRLQEALAELTALKVIKHFQFADSN